MPLLKRLRRQSVAVGLQMALDIIKNRQDTPTTSPVPNSYTNQGFDHTEENLRTISSLSSLSLNMSDTVTGRGTWKNFQTNLKTQTFTEQEKTTMSAFSSLNYTPTHSISYIQWLGQHKTRFYSRMEWDRWFVLFLIGLVVGLVATLLKQSIAALGKAQWQLTQSYLASSSIASGFFITFGISCAYILVSAILVTFVHMPAAGGGTPEVIAFLNGIIVHGTLSMKNLIVKFVANVFAVSSGVPAAIQGPLITYGAIIGAGIGQFQSKTLNFHPKIFKRFRNAEDRRGFTTAGVAAGVSAGFNSPIGGLLFAMEDVSSFWTKNLTWQTLFCSVIAAAVAQLINTAFSGFAYAKPFGNFNLETFQPISMHVLTLIPAIILGLFGGLCGAFFIRFNVFICRKRKKLLKKITSPHVQKVVRITETILLVFCMSMYSVLLPMGFSCEDSPVAINHTACNEWKPGKVTLFPYNCPIKITNGTTTRPYNEAASLIQNGGTTYLTKLWSRDNYFLFDYGTCLAAFVIYFFMTIWTAGSAIAGGIFVPVLVNGSLYGRALGVGLMNIWTSIHGVVCLSPQWMWLDPGVMAAIGAASLLGGVTRLALASTVIVLEMVGDIALVIPLFISIYVAKMTADQFSKPNYKYSLDSKTLPFLEQDPQVQVAGNNLNLEMCRAGDLMAAPVKTIHSKETVSNLALLLLKTKHSGFPVTKFDKETKMEVAYGLITRIELYVILSCEEIFNQDVPNVTVTPRIPYEDISVDYIPDISACNERCRNFVKFQNHIYSTIFVDLEPFINISTPKIDQDYSLHRTYVIFRTLGLRHLVVIDGRNRVVGIITRKDLMPFHVQEKLEALLVKQNKIREGNHMHANLNARKNAPIMADSNGNYPTETGENTETCSQDSVQKTEDSHSSQSEISDESRREDDCIKIPLETVSAMVENQEKEERSVDERQENRPNFAGITPL